MKRKVDLDVATDIVKKKYEDTTGKLVSMLGPEAELILALEDKSELDFDSHHVVPYLVAIEMNRMKFCAETILDKARSLQPGMHKLNPNNQEADEWIENNFDIFCHCMLTENYSWETGTEDYNVK